ncbi:DUF1761 domain-containing protein [Pacificoceanicola onchidii]|uniref:DUF1761 domain-containing protein n=1 Tax=Pacificoceanicola onchidii TaxID=2562685 RepID=UPI0010A5DB85|nr:DUF1761 domain-containing protein [Pacificoceanicola onchidii]
MELVSILVATIAAFAIGAVWYNVLSKPWIEATGIPVDEEGNPEGGMDPKLFAMGFVFQLIVAGFMRHVFTSSGVDGVFAGVVSGAGVGAFFITPWIALNNSYAGRPMKLTAIDGGYATLACAVMGLVLALF